MAVFLHRWVGLHARVREMKRLIILLVRVGYLGYGPYDGCYKGDFVMFVSFRVRNFRSFVDETLELRCEEGRGCEVGEGLPWVVPVLGMCGEAAAGEGAVWVEAMRAFHLVASLMPLSPQIREVVRMPNEEHPELRETEYSLEMTLNGWLYRYTLAHNGEGILREELWREEKPLYRIDHAAETYEFAGKTAGHGSAEVFRCGWRRSAGTRRASDLHASLANGHFPRLGKEGARGSALGGGRAADECGG